MIEINSSLGNYRVLFPEQSFDSFLQEIYNPGDVVVVDKNISLKFHGVLFSIESNEKAKDYRSVSVLIDFILSSGFKKNNKIIAVGGGIVQDICGFVCSILYRGVDWVFFPTTLLSQGDSCIGGKTSINFGRYKNQIGGFYPPSDIFIFVDFLDTLTDDAINSGLGEILHFYMVAGQLDYYVTHMHSYLSLIERSLGIKKYYIEVDEFDKQERLLLNYGHTFGHAIESITDYKIPHGIAVAFGMGISNYVSRSMGYLNSLFAGDLIDNLTRKYFYLYKNIVIGEYVNLLKQDKKNISSDKLRCVLTRGEGAMFLEEVSYEHLVPILEEYMENINE